MRLTKYSFKCGVLVGLFCLVTCQNFNKPTIQKYFVEKMDEPEFMVIDIPLVSFEDYFEDPEIQKWDVIRTIKKFNILLLLSREETKGKTKTERKRVNEILKNQEYESLISIASDGINVKLMVDSKDDTINEVLIQFYEEDIVFGLVRVLGKNIEAERIIPLFAEMNYSVLNNAIGNSLDENNQNILSDLFDAFKYSKDR